MRKITLLLFCGLMFSAKLNAQNLELIALSGLHNRSYLEIIEYLEPKNWQGGVTLSDLNNPFGCDKGQWKYKVGNSVQAEIDINRNCDDRCKRWTLYTTNKEWITKLRKMIEPSTLFEFIKNEVIDDEVLRWYRNTLNGDIWVVFENIVANSGSIHICSLK